MVCAACAKKLELGYCHFYLVASTSWLELRATVHTRIERTAVDC